MSIAPNTGIGGTGITSGASIGSSGIVSEGSSAPPAYTGPLDEVPDGIAWAASTTRALSAAMCGQTGYTLRRSSDDAELGYAYDATTGLIDFAAINTWKGVGDAFFKQLQDHSGLSRNVSNATAGSQPPYLSNELNGYPAIDFETGVLRYAPEDIDLSNLTSFHVLELPTIGVEYPDIFKFSSDSTSASVSCSFGKDDIGEDPYLIVSTSDDAGANIIFDTTTKSASYVGNYILVEFKASTGVAPSIRVNGVLQTMTGDQGNGVFGPCEDMLFQLLSCHQIEGFIYNANKSAGDCTTLRTNIATFYGITL